MSESSAGGASCPGRRHRTERPVVLILAYALGDRRNRIDRRIATVPIWADACMGRYASHLNVVMKRDGTRHPHEAHSPDAAPTRASSPGKTTLTESVPSSAAPVQAKAVDPGKGTLTASLSREAAPLQRKQNLAAALSPGTTHAVAAEGVSGGGGPLPYREQIQASFGGHDISDVRAHVGGEAAAASDALGARAYATGRDIAFAGAPDLHTAAHEAAHVVQQRGNVQLKGGIGETGDAYERHADAVADRVVQGAPAGDLLDQMAPSRAAPAAGVQRLQLALDGDLRTAARANPVDGARVLALIDGAPVGEVLTVAHNTALVRQVESHMPATADAVRARLARRVFIDGHQPVLAWSLITGDDRARRQRYLDAYGTAAEQRAFEDGVIDDGTHTGYMIRAFDSYWDVEARRQAGAHWNAAVIKAMHRQLKTLPDGDVRAQDVNGRVWQTIVLSVDPTMIDRAAFGGGEFTVGAHASTGFQQQMGYGTKLTANAAAGAVTLQVNEAGRLAVGDTIALGTGTQTLSVDPNYDRCTVTAVAGTTVTIGAGLAHGHQQDDVVAKIDAHGGSVKLAAAAAANAATIRVTDGTHFSVNDGFAIGTGDNVASSDAHYDHGTVTAIAGNVLTISPVLTHAHHTDDVVARTVAVGNNSALTAAVAPGATSLTVGAGSSFAVNDKIALGASANPTLADANFDWGRVTAIAGNALTVDRAMSHAHAAGDVVRRMDERGSGARDVNWLAGTVRHEIGHAVDASIPAVVTGFTVGLGGWWTGAEPATEADFDTWVAAMGGAAWTGATSGAPGHTTPITDADKARVRTAITHAVASGSGSLFAQGLPATHPIMRNRTHNVPVIVAAEACLSRGDNFYNNPEALYSSGGKVFSVSNWYKNFMYHNESIRAARLSDYSLYAPAEFFAETYTVFYEEAGRPGVTEADYGRLISSANQREWIRTNIHHRHMAPAGAGAGAPAGPGPEGAPASGTATAGVQPGSGTGKKAHRPGP
ncbi:MAG TPA: DUF4157 domain-containing protein [Kofleriaceae bacterium]|nr:DUF4157 domain-containing protein [Kofleriaceae bacterium]